MLGGLCSMPDGCVEINVVCVERCMGYRPTSGGFHDGLNESVCIDHFTQKSHSKHLFSRVSSSGEIMVLSH